MPDPLRTAAPVGVIHDHAVYEGAEPDPDPAPVPEPEPAEPAVLSYAVGEAAARGGAITVTATDSGLPLAVTVAPEQLRRDPDELAADLLRLCRLAAARAGLERRAYLAGLGVPESALALLGLPDRAAVERAELADEAEREYEPRSWLDPDGGRW